MFIVSRVASISGIGLSIAVLAAFFIAPVAPVAADEERGRIGFVAKNMLATANGVFHRWTVVESDINLDSLENGSVSIEIDVASLDTDNERRDHHLRTEDFFEVEAWPVARVRIHSATRGEGERWNAQFDIEIRGVRKTLPGSFEILNRKPFQVRGTLTIDRLDFGIGTPKTWNPMSITQEIPITFEATLP
jgi:polyisoprenoid-binding protein YceI